ncbi:MAG: tyrosine-type recombinase/integrase [Burkholderiales bacterium]
MCGCSARAERARTAQALQQLLAERDAARPEDCVFAAMGGEAMTRFGIYKRVRRLVGEGDGQQPGSKLARRITPHVFRHTTAVHLLEAGVEVNVIRGWLGHVSLEITNRYAEITRPVPHARRRFSPSATASCLLRCGSACRCRPGAAFPCRVRGARGRAACGADRAFNMRCTVVSALWYIDRGGLWTCGSVSARPA